jgi:hypothetical protein
MPILCCMFLGQPLASVAPSIVIPLKSAIPNTWEVHMHLCPSHSSSASHFNQCSPLPTAANPPPTLLCQSAIISHRRVGMREF